MRAGQDLTGGFGRVFGPLGTVWVRLFMYVPATPLGGSGSIDVDDNDVVGIDWDDTTLDLTSNPESLLEPADRMNQLELHCESYPFRAGIQVGTFDPTVQYYRWADWRAAVSEGGAPIGPPRARVPREANP